MAYIKTLSKKTQDLFQKEDYETKKFLDKYDMLPIEPEESEWHGEKI
jgi:hypothetical protein